MRRIEIPQNALVLLVGPAGSGKSTFASRHFRKSEIVSSDLCREMVSDDMEDMKCSSTAFELFHFWIEKRLQLGKLTVADATSLTPKARTTLRELAAKYNVPVVVFALETPLELCLQQNKERTRYVPQHVIEGHHKKATDLIPGLEQEGYHAVHRIVPRTDPVDVVLESTGSVTTAPGFDVIGDIHGCDDELLDLVFNRLGYHFNLEDTPNLYHPEGRKLVFVGDFTDRGPKNVEVLRFIRMALRDGHLAVPGNHCNKLQRYLNGNKVKVAHGLQRTIQQLEEDTTEEERREFYNMLSSLPYYLTLSVPGRQDLVVCHAGMPRDMVGRPQTGAVKSHCLYGETTGEVDENGYPVRTDNYVETWPADGPTLVHGHTVVSEPFVRKGFNVVNVDQGAVFGGYLSAFRYPEGQVISVPSAADYAAAWEVFKEGV